MKLTRAIHSRKLKFVFWTILTGSIAVASTTLPNDPPRKSTDPPAMAKGKLGQDLFLAIDHRDLAAVRDLIAKGADVNSKNGLEFTPLYIASASYQMDAMQALIGAGATVDAQSTYGTPLTFAASSGNIFGARILLAKGADVNAARDDGLSVLMMAANSGNPEFVAELIKRKADVNAKDIDGSTALHLAARAGHVEVGRALIEAGATVDAADSHGQTPLMAAAETGHPDFVSLLLKKGAKVNAKDSMGRTALVLAASYGDYPAVTHALLAGGADPKATGTNGRSAIGLAHQHGYKECAGLLGTDKPMAFMTRTRSPKEAIQISLNLIQSSMKKFNEMTNCVSCHQEGLGRMTTGVAQDRGFALDKGLLTAQNGRLNGMLSAMQPLHEGALHNPEVMKQIPLIEINELTTIDSWILSGDADHHIAPSPATAAMTLVLARQQQPDGHWTFSLPRAPMQSSSITFTALSVRAMQTYGPKGDADLAKRTQMAKTWLLAAPAHNSEDRASRLLGLKWAGASPAELQAAIAAVRADQGKDGGWSQLPGLHSDAYATGQALYALHVGGGVPASDQAYAHGVQFLLRTQDDDGSWFVNKRATPANNYFDAGFPHGESQYASFNGTCWATLALLETIKTK